MLTKTKKIALLTTGLAGTLLATTIGGIALSSCTYNVTNGSNTIDPNKNIYTTKIDWGNLEDVGQRLNIDENGLVYSDVYRTVLIGSLPNLSVSELVIPSTVKEISGYIDITTNKSNTTPQGAFANQANITSVRFQGQTQVINNNAFQGCTSLINVSLPSSLTTIGNNAFQGTGSISKINLNSVKFIGDNAFNASFSNLPPNTIDLSLDNAQFIGTSAFQGNPAIKSVNFANNKNLTNLGNSAFENSALPGTIDLSKATKLRTIGQSAFKGTTNLNTVKLPSSLTALGTNENNVGVFQNSSITSIDLSNTQLTTLNQLTFGGSKLETITFPETLTNVDVTAFASSKITSLDLSNTKVATINNNSFANAANLTEIKFPTTLRSIGQNSFMGTQLASADLSNTQITSIPNLAFQNLTSLTEVKVPAGLTQIGNNAFQGSGITSIDLTETKVNNIGNSAFENSQLADIKFPNLGNNFTQLNQAAFKNTKLTSIDLRNVNLTTLNHSLFEDCANLETVYVKSPDLEAAKTNPTTATPIQKQITTIGNMVFKNTNLKGIFHVVNDGNDNVYTADGVIKASPFLTSIGTGAFYNVNQIRVFDASNVLVPAANGAFIGQNLFGNDAEHTEGSQLQAVILPSVLDTVAFTSNNAATATEYWIGQTAFINNPKLKSVGTKKNLGFEETVAPEARADDYISKIKKPGFHASRSNLTIGNQAFRNTGIELVDFSEFPENRVSFGFGTALAPENLNDPTNNGANSIFRDSKQLKKVILPKGLQTLQANVFHNTPLLEEVNFDQLTNLATMGAGNFNTLQNFKSSKIIETPTAPTPDAKAEATTATTLDLSQTKLTALLDNTFTNLPSTVSEVKLPSTITTSTFVNPNTLTQVVDATADTPASTKKFALNNIKFFAANGEDQTVSKFQGFMTNATQTATANVNFYIGSDINLTHLKSLTTLSPSTFALNKDLKTLTLPAKATTWQISGTTGSGNTLTSNYGAAALSAQNKLEVIEFSGFGLDSTNTNLDGSNIEDLASGDWATKVLNDAVLTQIATMMNSLGYDAELEGVGKPENYSPKIGVQDIWTDARTENGSDGNPTLVKGSADWMSVPVEANFLKQSQSWYSTKEEISGDKGPKDDISTAPSDTKSVYLLHNGIIWNWTTTVDKTDTNNPKYTISLTPDESTLPNVYKAQAINNQGNSIGNYITTFRTQRFAKPASNAKADTAKFGVPFKFNIAVKAATKN